jgi:putative hydrolase of the HAD superfamily
MTIEAVLFDADGVIQRPAVGSRAAFEKLLGSRKASDVDEFMGDVFAVEQPALIARGEFEGSLADVLTEWQCQGNLDDALRAWTMIEVYTDIVEAIQRLRKSGLACCLATNQEAHRAKHMSRTLGYRDLFDREFYSCDVRSMKPDSQYFLRVIRKLELPAEHVAFLDDHDVNVAAAREVGLHAAQFEDKVGVGALWRALAELGIG